MITEPGVGRRDERRMDHIERTRQPLERGQTAGLRRYTAAVRRHRLLPIIVAALLAGSVGAGSPGIAATSAVALPLSGITIAVDPGHNGGNASHIAQISRLVWTGTGWRACSTVGTTTADGYPEHRFNWLVALRVKARLEALGATVYMTRTSDTGVGPCVDVRGRFGTKMHAQLTVAIHADGSASTHRGFYVMRPGLIRGYTDDIYSRSATLATAVRAGLLRPGSRSPTTTPPPGSGREPTSPPSTCRTSRR